MLEKEVAMLDKNSLKSSLVALLTFPNINTNVYTASYMASEFANAYDNYATSAVDALGNTVSGMNKSGMQAKFLEAFSQYDVTVTLTKITEGINLYWTGVTLSTSNLPPGAVTPITNVVDGTPNSISFDTGLKTSVSDGADTIVNYSSYGLDPKTKTVTTLFSYLDSVPSPQTYNSTLR